MKVINCFRQNQMNCKEKCWSFDCLFFAPVDVDSQHFGAEFLSSTKPDSKNQSNGFRWIQSCGSVGWSVSSIYLMFVRLSAPLFSYFSKHIVAQVWCAWWLCYHLSSTQRLLSLSNRICWSKSRLYQWHDARCCKTCWNLPKRQCFRTLREGESSHSHIVLCFEK